MTGIWYFQPSARGRRQPHNSLVTSLLPQEPQFEGRQLPEGSMRQDCVPESRLFASHSLPPTKESVYNGAYNTDFGHSFNGLMFSSRMNPDSVYNLFPGESSYGGNVEPDTIPATSGKGTHMVVEV